MKSLLDSTQQKYYALLRINSFSLFQGEYTVVFEAFSGHHEDLVLCMNYTFIIKEKLYA